MGPELRALDGRSRDVLASVVVSYIESAIPVSSRHLTRTGQFGLSSASLRNAMADLEEAGFLMHPHVSAGRVPTDLGYRTFVEELMTARAPSEAERARIAAELTAAEVFELDRFLQATSRILSELTGEVAVVAAPAPMSFVLDSVHFTRLSERKVLVAQVSDAGLVESRLIETKDDFSQAQLDAIARRLTVDFAGKSLHEIRELLLRSLEEEKVRVDAELRRAIELGRRAFDGRAADEALYVDGTGSLLSKPEFRHDVQALRRMFHAFDEKARLVGFLTDCLSSHGGRVVIGSESRFTEETQSAVVTAPYRRGERVLGVLAVVGPRRMEYARIVPMVEELGRYVTRRLTEGA